MNFFQTAWILDDIGNMLNTIFQVFSFIFSILSDIINGVLGIGIILINLSGILISLVRILPEPIFSAFITFLACYIAIVIYKTAKGNL